MQEVEKKKGSELGSSIEISTRALTEVQKLASSKTILVMNVSDTYPELKGKVPGIDYYSTRASAFALNALMSNGVVRVIVMPESKRIGTEELLNYLRKSFGLSAKFIFVDHKDFTRGAIGAVLDYLRESGYSLKQSVEILANKLLLFGYSNETLRDIESAFNEKEVGHLFDYFKSLIGEDSFEAFVTSSELSPNSKLFFRKSFQDFFDSQYNARAQAIAFASAQEVLDDKDILKDKLVSSKRVFVKRMDAASGVGIKSIDLNSEHDFDSLLKHLYELERQNINLSNVLVESVAPNTDMEFSAQFWIDKKYEAKFLGVTEQIIKDNEHKGNVTSFDPGFINKILRSDDIEYLRQFVSKLAKESSYKGYLSIDLVGNKNKWAPLEANARVTGATAPLFVAASLSFASLQDKFFPYISTLNTFSFAEIAKAKYPELEQNQINAKIEKLHMDSVLSVLRNAELLASFGKDGFKKGVIPYLAALPSKTGLLAVARSKKEAEETMQKAQDVLSELV